MWPNPQETADFVTFSQEILNGKHHFLCRVNWKLATMDLLNNDSECWYHQLGHVTRFYCCQKLARDLLNLLEISLRERYFSVFGLNTAKIWTRKNSVFGHFSRSVWEACETAWLKELVPRPLNFLGTSRRIFSCIIKIYLWKWICDGVILEIYLDHKFQWPQEDLNCESLAYEVVT